MEICKPVDLFLYVPDLRHQRVKASNVDRLLLQRNLIEKRKETELRIDWFVVFYEIFRKIRISGKIKYEEAKA